MKDRVNRMSHTFTDVNTGEVLTGRQLLNELIEESEGTEQYDWVRVYVRVLPYLCKIVSSKGFDILVYILSNIDFGDNGFVGSYEKIAEATGAGYATVARTMEKMCQEDFIRPKGAKSSWMVNPIYGYAGKKSKGAYLEEKFWDLPSSGHFSRYRSENGRET